MSKKIVVFWFRRDLRLDDNHAFFRALISGSSVLPVFIFDKNILQKLTNPSDARVTFIHGTITRLKSEIEKYDSTLHLFFEEPLTVFKKLIEEYRVNAVFANEDYEPYAKKRDKKVQDFLSSKQIAFHTYTDQIVLHPGEVMKQDQTPYTVFTPYSKKWKSICSEEKLNAFESEKRLGNLYQCRPLPLISIEELGFKRSNVSFPPCEINREIISNYEKTRDIPGIEGTTRLGLHLRFGTISIRKLTRVAYELSETFLNELIWRNFFMDILYHFPRVVDEPFKTKYQFINWRNSEADFARWCQGRTGYPMVDAGMRELNTTGFMHNRVRMICAGFLTKHLLINWQWGEAYFAEKLFDFDLSANNGNWQWAAGCGCDAAPYFRIFNPEAQLKKFDKDGEYICKWLSEYGTVAYPQPMVDHKKARQRALEVYKQGLEG